MKRGISVLQRAWYAVCTSDEVTTLPHKVTVNDVSYVLFRGEDGAVIACQAHCPHRGCDLSLGKVEADKIVCAFHGWAFNKDGVCTRIPANRSGAVIPKQAALRMYPTTEKHGLVWLYPIPISEETPEPLKVFPDLMHEDWHYVQFEQLWDAHFTRVVESVLDVSHLPFVHPETTGTDINPAVEGPDYELSDEGIRIFPTPFAPKHPMEPVQADPNADKRTEIELLFPNQWMIRTPVGNGNIMCTYLTFTPIDAESTKIFGVIMRNFEADSEWLDDFHLEHTLRVMSEDQTIIESIAPKEAPFQLQEEAHVPSDVPTIRFRTMLRDALEKEAQGK